MLEELLPFGVKDIYKEGRNDLACSLTMSAEERLKASIFTRDY